MKKKIIIAGGTGYIGTALSTVLKPTYDIHILTRKLPNKHTTNLTFHLWEPQNLLNTPVEQSKLIEIIDNSYAIINLSGYPIDNGRLNETHKRLVIESRLLSTNVLLQLYAKCKNKPPLWLQTSAIGIYGNTDNMIINEKSSLNQDSNNFFVELCKKWENTILKSKIINSNTKVSILRIGIVFSKQAKAWKKMSFPIKFGLGGKLGSGEQWYSWIHLDDVCAGIQFILNKKLQGIFNFTAPTPIQQKQLVRTIAQHYKRPAFLGVPSFALKILLGDEIANLLVLSSSHVIPQALLNKGFIFQYATLQEALDIL